MVPIVERVVRGDGEGDVCFLESFGKLDELAHMSYQGLSSFWGFNATARRVVLICMSRCGQR